MLATLELVNALEVTHAVTLVRPWSGGKSDRELVQAPKAYGFDTGFVCFARSIRELRPDDRGHLLEHLVLESLQATADLPRVHYWRDKSGREVDFVIPRGDAIDAIEVRWNADAFEAKHLAHFRGLYPQGENLVVTGATTLRETRSFGDLRVTFLPISDLRAHLSAGS